MDFGKAFTFMFQDRSWVNKILLGGLFTLLAVFLIGIPILLGYFRKTFLAVVENPDAPLPEWDAGKEFIDGLPVLGAILCYAIVDLIVVVALSFVFCIGPIVAFLFTLAVAFVLPAALTRLFVTNRFGAIFEFDAILKYIADNPGDYVVALVIFVLSAMLSSLGVVFCGVGLLFTTFWSRLVGFHALAQAYRGSLAKAS